MSQNIFNRTVKTNIVLYPTDGRGRDCYITYNNAGFWKDNINRISTKEKYGRKPISTFHSLRRTPPIWHYHADGTGRDGYVLYDYGGLIHRFDSSNSNTNNKYLRNSNDDYMSNTHYRNNFLSRDERIYQQKLNQIQNNLVKRLYYKPKRELKFLHKEGSAPNIFSNRQFEPIKNLNENSVNNEKDQNLYNNYYNNDYNFDNDLAKSQMRNGFFDSKNNNKDSIYNKRNNSFKRYRVKCLANTIDDRIYSYPFNQFTYKKNKIEEFN